MKLKLFGVVLLAISLVFASAARQALAEEPAKFELFGVSLGMEKETIREMFTEGLIQEPEDLKTGATGLVYRMSINEFDALVSFAFYEEILFNIEIMVFSDAESDFYRFMQSVFTKRYGEPVTEEIALEEPLSPVSQMIRLLRRTTRDIDFKGWQGDRDTVVVISRDSNQVSYVEIRSISYYLLPMQKA